MFGTNRIMATWMIGTVGFAVVLTDRFMLAMGYASLAFFTFHFFTMLYAIMLDSVNCGLMILAMLWLNFRSCDYGRRYRGCSNCRGTRFH
jgi:hypothetical protein